MAYLDYNDFCNYEQDFCRFIMVRIDTIINHLAVQWVLRDICRIRDKNLDRWKNFGSMQNWLLLMDIKLHVTIIPLHLSAILTATRYCYIRETIVPINGYSWKTHYWNTIGLDIWWNIRRILCSSSLKNLIRNSFVISNRNLTSL